MVLWTLRHKAAEDEDQGDGDETEYVEAGTAPRKSTGWRSLFGGTHFSTLQVKEPVTTHPVRIHRIADASRGEGYEAEKYRAFGDCSIFGQVRGDKGAVLPNAKVQLFENDPMTKNPPLRESVTDNEGSYTLTQINGGDRYYILVVRCEGYVPEAHRIALNGYPLQMNVRLERGVELSGVVLDAQTSMGISGATVYYPSTSGMIYGVLGSVETGPAGQFRFDAVHPKNNHVMAEKEGYHHTVKVIKAPTTEAQIPMEPGGAVLRGVAVERLGEKPVVGAKIVLRCGEFEDSVLSKEEGRFEFQDLPGGKYRLWGVHGMPSARQEITLGDREVREDVKVVLPSELFVTGRVVEANTGRALPGIHIHYKSPSGKSSVVSDDLGQFGFETMVLSEYTMEIHEKNYLPVQDKKTTEAIETITRKIQPSASSDEVTIRLRRVPAISGVVMRSRKSANGKVIPNSNANNANNGSKSKRPAWGVDVRVAYVQGKVFEQKVTQTDPLGKFFFNLPNKGRGTAKIIAQQRNTVDVASVKIPSRKDTEMLLKPTLVQGLLVLTDASELSGLRVALNYFFPDNLPPERALRLKGAEQFTNGGGGFALPAAQKQKVELVFSLPDGKVIPKVYDSDLLLRKRQYFVYDPVAGDILSNAGRAGVKKPTGQRGGAQGGQNKENKKDKTGNQGNNPGKQNKADKQPTAAS